jgi:hypothetical protein
LRRDGELCSPLSRRVAQAHGMLEILWTVDSADSLGANYAGIERNVIGGGAGCGSKAGSSLGGS